MRVGSPSTLKKRRLTTIDPMEIESVRERLEAAKQKFGREIRVFETSAASSVTNDASSTEVSDDFYEFTPEDYYRLLGTKKEDKFLKTKKIREREEAARRSKITKAVIRVRFPDNYTLEATFHPSEKIQSLYELLNKVIAQPELPFYIYTTPPKKQVKDMSQDFFAAGFVPGAIVYFSYDLPKGAGEDGGVSVSSSGPFLDEDVLSLNGLELPPVEAAEPAPQTVTAAASPSQAALPERKPTTDKKPAKPKWLKL